jgi:hypothetical protein
MKLSLDIDEIAEAFFEDTNLLGIMAPMPAHQFVWQVNQSIRFDFRIQSDLEISLKRKNRNYFFPVYAFQEPGYVLTNYIYKNLFDGEYLLPEFKHLDYLWLCKGDLPSPEEEKLLVEDLRNIPGVQMVVELGQEKIKNRQNLMF